MPARNIELDSTGLWSVRLVPGEAVVLKPGRSIRVFNISLPRDIESTGAKPKRVSLQIGTRPTGSEKGGIPLAAANLLPKARDQTDAAILLSPHLEYILETKSKTGIHVLGEFTGPVAEGATPKTIMRTVVRLRNPADNENASRAGTELIQSENADAASNADDGDTIVEGSERAESEPAMSAEAQFIRNLQNGTYEFNIFNGNSQIAELEEEEAAVELLQECESVNDEGWEEGVEGEEEEEEEGDGDGEGEGEAEEEEEDELQEEEYTEENRPDGRRRRN